MLQWFLLIITVIVKLLETILPKSTRLVKNFSATNPFMFVSYGSKPSFSSGFWEEKVCVILTRFRLNYVLTGCMDSFVISDRYGI